MAADLLESAGQLFGPIRGGIAYAVIFVGALLAATTGVVTASVIAMGLISLPVMMRYGYSREVSAGVIYAFGTLAQVVLPDVLGVSVGDAYKGALIPSLMLVGLLALYIFALSIFRPQAVPAPPEARTLRGAALFRQVMRSALGTTASLSTFVLFILIGSTVFGLTFRAVNGDLWGEHLFSLVPSGQVGFLIVVNLLVFAPVAEKLGIGMVWFLVLIGMNMQTSFLLLPFGFALFYLRSVAPVDSYLDKTLGRRLEGVTTTQIYRGVVPFIVIQLIAPILVASFPSLVTATLDRHGKVDTSTVEIVLPPEESGADTADDPGENSDALGRGGAPKGD
ncbi:TRAP transporter large permease subunit [Denitromonas sp.]|uniref:TRAP transporter large permease subunit n=1 Tax=Denitromonas sp. TaxID=2734609 RepID=UPI003A8A2B72